MEGYQDTSFLDLLLGKRAMVCALAASGLEVKAALIEVDRQIKQALAGNFISGEGVTKSGEED
jgi:hypothetical protein